jgi:hypothetical protein
MHAFRDRRGHIRQTTFDSGKLLRPYHSIDTDVNDHIRFPE